MKKKLFIVLLGMVMLLSIMSCAPRKYLLDPKNFKYFEGTLIHYYGKILVMESTIDESTMCFLIGRRTVFMPVRQLPTNGSRLIIKYLTKAYSHRKVGEYFIAFEVHNEY